VYFHARDKRRWDFNRELERVLQKGYYVSYPIYSDGDQPIVDFIVNFERMQEDLARLSEKLGFDVAAHYPKTKHQFRSERRPASELLSDAAKATIYEQCRVEFDALGFER
jgi:hypothetical protein